MWKRICFLFFFLLLLDGTKQTTITWQQASDASNGQAANAAHASYASNASGPSWSVIKYWIKTDYYCKPLYYCALFVRAHESKTGQKDSFSIWHFFSFIYKLRGSTWSRFGRFLALNLGHIRSEMGRVLWSVPYIIPIGLQPKLCPKSPKSFRPKIGMACPITFLIVN